MDIGSGPISVLKSGRLLYTVFRTWGIYSNPSLISRICFVREGNLLVFFRTNSITITPVWNYGWFSSMIFQQIFTTFSPVLVDHCDSIFIGRLFCTLWHLPKACPNNRTESSDWANATGSAKMDHSSICIQVWWLSEGYSDSIHWVLLLLKLTHCIFLCVCVCVKSLYSDICHNRVHGLSNSHYEKETKGRVHCQANVLWQEQDF